MRKALTLAAALLITLTTAAQQPRTIAVDPNRHTLYTQTELYQGFNATTQNPGWDARIYDQYVRFARHSPSPATTRLIALHDAAISSALDAYLLQHPPSTIVSVTGNALENIRCTAVYRQTAELGYALTRAGYLVATGGGPGEMEAANLGAYLANQPPAAIDEAIQILRARATSSPDPTNCTYPTRLTATQAAMDVLKRFPNGADSLGIPTWFYGWEPTNVFALHVAKYFSNAIREDRLMEIGAAGSIYTEGRAGLRQEIFQKATQNDFATFCNVAPQVFLGTHAFGDSGLYAASSTFATQAPLPVGDYSSYFLLTDSVPETVAFLKSHPTRIIVTTEGPCAKS